MKARLALDRALGRRLEENNGLFDDVIRGKFGEEQLLRVIWEALSGGTRTVIPPTPFPIVRIRKTRRTVHPRMPIKI